MPLTVERLPGEPIVVARFTGKVTAELVHEMFAESARFADEIGDRVHRISDVSDIETTFSDLILILAEASHGQPGSPSDPRFQGTLVGANAWAKMYSDSLQQQQYGQLNIPVFDTFDAALAHIRSQIKDQTASG
jgi:hypothetical protein